MVRTVQVEALMTVAVASAVELAGRVLRVKPGDRGEQWLPRIYKMRKSSHGDVMLPVGVHLPTVKVGCQKLRGQVKTEMKY